MNDALAFFGEIVFIIVFGCLLGEGIATRFGRKS